MKKIFKNMKVGKKLVLSFILVSVISSVAAILGLVNLITADTSYSNALVYYGFSQGNVGNFLASLNEGRSVLKDIILYSTPQDLAEAQAMLEEDVANADKYLTLVRDSLTDVPEELALFKTIEDNLPLYREQRDKVVQLGLAGSDEEAQRVLREDADIPYEKIHTAVQDLLLRYQSTGTQLSSDLTGQSRFSLIMMIVVMMISATISILISIFIARSISVPMKQCSERLTALSHGDLRTPVPEIDSKDETGILAAATAVLVQKLNGVLGDLIHILGEMSHGNMNVSSTAAYEEDFLPLQTSTNQIISSFNDTLGKINQSADQVSSGSEQVSGGSQALSQGATEQASAVQELAATITEISGQVRSTAENAQEASRKANSVGAEMTESNRQMQDMITAMAEISGSSQEIGKIIKTIEDIAFQTNILALNAAVEAARAGAAGKGFAVVADEVRNLASKSAEASKNTASLIETSIQAVRHGTQIADKTAQSLLVAVDGAKSVAQTVDLISNASNQQASSIAQVTQGIDQISSVVQTNSATAEESAAASEELSGQAQILKQLVSRFHLKVNDEYPGLTYTEM